MSLRLLITDAIWSEIEPIWKAIKHPAGSPPKLGDRLFLEAVLYQARTGIPWRDLPRDFGDWNAVYHRFRRIATRYEKLSRTFMAFVHIVSTWIIKPMNRKKVIEINGLIGMLGGADGIRTRDPRRDRPVF